MLPAHTALVFGVERRNLAAGTVALLVWLSACTGRASTEAAVQAVDSAGMRIATITAAPSEVAEWTVSSTSILTMTGAETGDSSAFATIGAVRWLGDGRIVVADVAANRLLVFDSTGRYLRALGRAGDGPGEFRYIGSVSALPGDSLATFDGRLRRLSLWHPDRGFVRAIPVGGGSLESWPEDAWLWRDSLVVVLQLSVTPQDSVAPGSGVRRWPMRARLTLHDLGGSILGTSPEFAGKYSGLHATGDTRLPFSNQPFIAVARDRVYFGSGDRFALSYLDTAFAWAGDLRWPGQQEALTPEEVNQVRTEAEILAATRMPPARARARLANSFASEILPKERPAIGRVFVAPDGNLWIERFEATRLGPALQKAGKRWTVLAADGRPLARVALPAGSRLEAVRNSHAILVLRDSLNIQTVAVRELLRP